MSGGQSKQTVWSQSEAEDGKRSRTSFTETQITALEEQFANCHYPDATLKRTLSVQLGLTASRITVWFQNRRAKWRRKQKKIQERNQKEEYRTSETSHPLQPPHINTLTQQPDPLGHPPAHDNYVAAVNVHSIQENPFHKSTYPAYYWERQPPFQITQPPPETGYEDGMHL